jgi:hypothetical protein
VPSDAIDLTAAAARLAERRRVVAPNHLTRPQSRRWSHIARTKLATRLFRSRPRVEREAWSYFGSFGDDFFDEPGDQSDDTTGPSIIQITYRLN